MREIILRGLDLQNFKSFVEPTSVSFSAQGGFKFLAGINNVEPRLGANGAGKTSLWDALVWCLYGSSIKGQKASALCSRGASRPAVSATLDIDDETFTIRRLGNPEVIAVDGELTTQAGLNALLGLSRGRFLHSVIFGQGVPFFIDLSPTDRGALLDEVLDLGVWQQAGAKAKANADEWRADLGVQQSELSFAAGKLAGMEDPDALAGQEAAWDAARASRLDAAIAKVEEAEREQAAMAQRVLDAKGLLATIPAYALTEQQTKLTRLKAQLDRDQADYQLQFARMNACQSELDYANNNPNCPTCRQPFPAAKRKATRAQLAADLIDMKNALKHNGHKANMLSATRHELEGEYDKLARKREFYESRLREADQACQMQEAKIASLIEQAEDIGAGEANPYIARREQLAQARAACQGEIAALGAAVRRLQGQLELVDFWRDGFKRVRLFMVRRVLAHLELETANAAEALGLAGWRISYVTEIETKSGGFKQGVQVQITSPQGSGAWELWSGGEGQRLRLACALGLAAMIQRMAGLNFNFEVWDEPSSWLSPEGIEDMLDCLKYRAEVTGKSVWLLDHRALLHSGFSEIWQVAKDPGGSSLLRLS